MKTKDIQKQIKTLESKKEEIDKKINSFKIELENESNKSEWIKIPRINYEVTKNVLHKGKSYNEIIKLKKPEEELLTLKIIGIICEYPNLLKELKMDSSSINDDFFFKQPFPQNEKRGKVARFSADSDCAYLDCGGYSSGSYSYLGVRFVRKVGSKK
jgi:hypothetical protein